MVSLEKTVFVLCIILVQIILITATPVLTNGGQAGVNAKISHSEGSGNLDEPRVSAWSFNSGSNDDDDWSWKKHNLGVDDQYTRSAKLIQVISYIVIALVLLSFAAFLICLCCPVCILSKLRERRRARHTVTYSGQAATPLTHVTTGNTLPSQTPNGPQMIAITNNDHRSTNSPYPVQQTVTLVMLAPSFNSSAIGNYNPHGQAVSYQPSEVPNSIIPTDPPPPYPGHEPKSFSNQSGLPSQLPYNPYYSGPPAASEDNPESSNRTAPPYSPSPTAKN